MTLNESFESIPYNLVIIRVVMRIFLIFFKIFFKFLPWGILNEWEFAFESENDF